MDKYDVIESDISSGSYGIIDLVQSHRTGELLAMKVINCSTEKELKDFHQEVEMLKALKAQCANLLCLVDHFIADKKCYVVTNYINDSTTLLVYMPRHKFADKIDIFLKICQATNTLHQLGIIHLDLKPENILIRDTGDEYEIFIIDYGFSCFIDACHKGKGTPNHVAPEVIIQKFDRSPIGPWSDIYSLGIIGYWMLSSKMPIKSPSIGQLLTIKSFPDSYQKELIPLEHYQDLRENLMAKLVIKMIAFDPKERPTLNQIIEQLHDL